MPAAAETKRLQHNLERVRAAVDLAPDMIVGQVEDGNDLADPLEDIYPHLTRLDDQIQGLMDDIIDYPDYRDQIRSMSHAMQVVNRSFDPVAIAQVIDKQMEGAS